MQSLHRYVKLPLKLPFLTVKKKLIFLFEEKFHIIFGTS